jgi:hypothetical protein
MKKLSVVLVLALLVSVLLVPSVAQADTDQEDACWGQASAVFAQTGKMGDHASSEPTPRLGLGNLAKALYDAGDINDDSLSALGAFVAAELGLDVGACQ